MKNTLLLLFILFSVNLYSQIHKVSFSVTANGMNDSDKIFITGNINQLGSWSPNKVQLTKVSNNRWEKSFELEEGTLLEYKFTLGSWQKEALDKNGNIPENSVLKVLSDTTVKIKIDKWKSILTKSFQGQITGYVEYINNLSFKALKNRDLIIWLPPSYKFDQTKRYPVLYMQDGQNIVDPATSSFGIDWQIDETADSLISVSKIKELIIVGIYNTSDRSEEYSPGTLGELYMEMIVKKIKPMIDKRYRTLKDRKNTAVAGSSMGGLISLMLIINYPEYFSMAACLSPAFKYNGFDYTPEIEKLEKDNGIKLYIDNGTVGLEEKLLPGVLEAKKKLLNLGFTEGKDFIFFIDKNATHNEAAWAKRTYRYLEYFFGTE